MKTMKKIIILIAAFMMLAFASCEEDPFSVDLSDENHKVKVDVKYKMYNEPFRDTIINSLMFKVNKLDGNNYEELVLDTVTDEDDFITHWKYETEYDSTMKDSLDFYVREMASVRFSAVGDEHLDYNGDHWYFFWDINEEHQNLVDMETYPYVFNAHWVWTPRHEIHRNADGYLTVTITYDNEIIVEKELRGISDHKYFIKKFDFTCPIEKKS